jgi:phenylacetate-CoA ligase
MTNSISGSGPAECIEASYFDAAIETMPRDQLIELQESRLMQLVPYVYKRSPLIREVWGAVGVTPADIRSMADFKAKVPFIDKDTIRAFRDKHGDPFGGLSCATAPHLKGVGFTSGTTGDPTPVPREEETGQAMDLKRDFWQIGMRPGDYLSMLLFTYREGHYADRFQDAGFRPIVFQHDPRALPRLLEANRRFQPRLLYIISTPLILALEQAEKAGFDVKAEFSCYKGAVFGGEPLAPRLRGLVDRWGMEIFEYSALGDVTGAMECRAHDGYHTWEDLVLLEHLDPNGAEPVADGERGELVVTALIDDVGPLVRFRSDDLIEYTGAPCRCGRTHGRMWPVGRKGDEMLIAGRSVLPRELYPLVQEHAETSAGLFQLVRTQRESDRLVLRVGYAPDALKTSEAELAGRLAERIGASLLVPVDVQLRHDDDLLKLGPPHKIPRVTQS